jgi:hypothetical protein
VPLGWNIALVAVGLVLLTSARLVIKVRRRLAHLLLGEQTLTSSGERRSLHRYRVIGWCFVLGGGLMLMASR